MFDGVNNPVVATHANVLLSLVGVELSKVLAVVAQPLKHYFKSNPLSQISMPQRKISTSRAVI